MFFALLPEKGLSEQIKGYVNKIKIEEKQLVIVENYHITLSFMGAQPAATIRCLRAVADTIKAEPFALQLDQFGYWEKPAVVWLGPRQVPAALDELVRLLNSRLQQCCGIVRDTQPYRPHVTLMRKVKRTATLAPIFANSPGLNWWVSRFALMESKRVDGVLRYLPLEQWTLIPPSDE